MSAPFDPWATLGVERDADLATIRAAWKRLARQTHPDRNPGDPRAEQRFKDASAAWSALKDPDARERLRHAPRTPHQPEPPDALRALVEEARRALDEIAEILFRRVLPSYVARYERGDGAELCWTLLRDIDDLSLLDLAAAEGPPGFGARSRSDDLLRRLRLRLDLRARLDGAGEPVLAELTLVEDRGLRWAAITVWVGSLHLADLHDPDTLRVRLLPAIAREVVRALESELPARLRVLRWRAHTGKTGFPYEPRVARQHDTRQVVVRSARIAIASILVATAAWALAWALTGRIWPL